MISPETHSQSWGFFHFIQILFISWLSLMKEGNIIEWNIVFCSQNVADRENNLKEVIFFYFYVILVPYRLVNLYCILCNIHDTFCKKIWWKFCNNNNNYYCCIIISGRYIIYVYLQTASSWSLLMVRSRANRDFITIIWRHPV